MVPTTLPLVADQVPPEEAVETVRVVLLHMEVVEVVLLGVGFTVNVRCAVHPENSF